jgi:sialate O-acetylesterase
MKSKLVLVSLFLSGLCANALELEAPFADNGVLQRELPLPVWGWSKPGTEVTVEFAVGCI